MTSTPVQAAGFEALDLVTDLLQQQRLRDPHGDFEAADFHWWWRGDQRPDADLATFWLDADDRPAAGVVATTWPHGGFTIEVLLREEDEALLALAWPVALALLDRLDGAVLGAEDGTLAAAAAATAGLVADEDHMRTCWRDLPVPAPGLPPHGLRLTTAAEESHDEFHARRSSADVGERLAEVSLYRRDHDLALRTPDGEVVGNVIVWADPVTGVGQVEPMGVEDAHHGKGLGTYLMAAGLHALTLAGSTRAKVAFEVGNEPAERLYRGSGFTPVGTHRDYRRP